MTVDELNASKTKCYALALLRIAELERQLSALNIDVRGIAECARNHSAMTPVRDLRQLLLRVADALDAATK